MKTFKSVGYLFAFFLCCLAACQKEQFGDTTNSRIHEGNIKAGELGNFILYHDINPDWEKHGYGLLNDSLNIDINGDGTTDVVIKYNTFLSGSEYDQQTSAYCLDGVSICPVPKNEYDSISNSSGWASKTLICFTKIGFMTNDTAYTGLWTGVKNKYLGVRIVKNRRVFYGWIRISLLVPPDIIYVQQIIVKDFACTTD